MYDNEPNEDDIEERFDICDYLNEYYMRLNESENSVITKYLEEESRSEVIFNKMSKCLNTLNKFESILIHLKENLNDLGRNVSGIGEETGNLNVSIENRINLRSHIRKYIDDMMIPPIMIDVITNNLVNDQAFIEQLHDLSHKITTMKSYDQIGAYSLDDTRNVVSDLKNIACEKVKLYLLKRIDHCKKHTTNYAIIQSSLLSHNFLYHFLKTNDNTSADNVLQSYIDVMQHLYYETMKMYIKNLTKLIDTTNIPNINQLLGSDITSKSNNTIWKSSHKVHIGDDLYSIGERGKILNEDLFLDSLIPHMITTKQKLSIEVIFRSLLYALLSNCFNEIDFINDFFKIIDQNQFDNYFDSIFGRCFQYFLGAMDTFFAQYLDYVGYILCIGITSRYSVVTKRKNLNVCSKYLGSILDMLWFRFNEIVNFNIASLSSSININYTHVNLLPHLISCRCSNAISTLLAINGASPFRKIEDTIITIFKEWRGVIENISNEFQIKTDRLIFIGNNLFYMMESIHNNVSIPFPDGFKLSPEKTNDSQFKHTLLDDISSDIDVIINDIITIDIDKQFSFYIDTIHDFLKNESPDYCTLKKKSNDEMTQIVTEFLENFKSNWKVSLKNITNRYKVLFFSMNLNMKLTQRYLNRFIQSYNIILDFVQGPFSKNLNTNSNLSYIDIQVIMIEIKKYTNLIS